MNEDREAYGKPVVAFDGKVLRGAYRNEKKSALQLVTVFDVENGLVLSQLPTANKRGKICVVRQMMDFLNIKGSILTFDAIQCQTETLKKASEKKHMLLFR